MSRVYIQPSWAGACESHPEWSGVHPDYRKCSSQELKINSKAPRKPKAKRSAFEAIALADSLYTRLEKQLEALEHEFDNGLISVEDFTYAHRLQTERMQKVWKRIEKARGWDREKESLTAEQEQPINEHMPNSVFFENVFLSLRQDNVFRQAYELAIRFKVAFGIIFNRKNEEK